MIKTKAAAALILVSLIATSFGSAPVWADDGESGGTILPQSVKDGLSQRCNVGEIVSVYQDYAAKISATKSEAQPSPAETTPQLTPDQTAPQPTPDTAQVQVSNDEPIAQLNQLREEIRAIVEKCVTKELQNLKCPTNACDAGAFAQQATRIARDYFANEELATMCQYSKWPRGENLCDQLFKQVKECLEKLFNDCGCDIECLKCLVNAIYSDRYYLQLANRDGYSNVVDYMLDWTGPLGFPGDFPMYIEEERPGGLIDRILKKFKECGYQPQEPEQFTPPELEQITTEELPIPGREEPDKDKEAEVPFAKELKKLVEEAGKAVVGEKEADKQKELEEAFKMLEKLLEDAKEKEEDAGKEAESASRLPRVTVMMLSKVGLIEDEGASGPIDFYTSAPRIDVSMFKAITENTEAEVKITAPIMSETPEETREIIIEVIGSEVILKDEGAEAKATLPLVIKENKLYAGEDDLYPISLLPGEINAGLEVPPVEINLEYDENRGPVYKVLLEEKAKLVFVPLELTREVTVDPASGEVQNIKQPWWSFSVSKQDIPEVFYQAKEAPQCLCESIKVKATKIMPVYPTKVEKKQTTVKIEEVDEKTNTKKQIELLGVSVEYYETAIWVKLEVKLKCCPEPKKQECTATVTVKPDEPYCSAGSVTLHDKYEVPRTVVVSSTIAGYDSEKKKEITQPFKVISKCGGSTKTETFWIRHVIRLERRLTPKEFNDEASQKDEVKIKNMMADTSVSATFYLKFTCEGWEEEAGGSTSLTVDLEPKKWGLKVTGEAAKEVEVKKPCK